MNDILSSLIWILQTREQRGQRLPFLWLWDKCANENKMSRQANYMEKEGENNGK